MKKGDTNWDRENLDRWIERFRLRARARDAIKTLCPDHIPQRELERLLGLSPGYLCRLRSLKGTSTPSAAMVSTLALLARDPARINELREYWAQPPDPVRVEGRKKAEDKGSEPK
jgi:hypothetical protein